MRGLMYGEFDHVALVTMKRRGAGDREPAARRHPGQGRAHRRHARSRPAAREGPSAARRSKRRAIRSAAEPRASRSTNAGAAAARDRRRSSTAGDTCAASVERVRRELAPGETATSRSRRSDGARAAGRARPRPRALDAALERAGWTRPSRSPASRCCFRSGASPSRACAGGSRSTARSGEWGALPLVVDSPVQVDAPELHAGPADAIVPPRESVGTSSGCTWPSTRSTTRSCSRPTRPGASRITWPSASTRAPIRRVRPTRTPTPRSRDGTLRALFLPNAAPVEPRLDPITRLFLGGLPEGTRIASQRSARGYTAELAIPAAALDKLAGGALARAAHQREPARLRRGRDGSLGGVVPSESPGKPRRARAPAPSSGGRIGSPDESRRLLRPPSSPAHRAGRDRRAPRRRGAGAHPRERGLRQRRAHRRRLPAGDAGSDGARPRGGWCGRGRRTRGDLRARAGTTS